MKRYTISDIARMANVSPASVSRVLSGRPGVNKVKRQEILQIIKETNYHPNSLAQGLVRGRSNIIGLIVRDLENQYYASLAVLVQRQLMDRGYLTMVVDIGKPRVDPSDDSRPDFISEITRQFDFAGLLISVPHRNDLLVDSVRNCNCPVVLLNRVFDASCDQVTQNDFQAGYLAGEYLLSLGHRDFLVLAGPVQDSTSCRFRLEGFMQAVAVGGVEMDESNILESDMDMETAYKLGLQVLERYPHLPQAVFIGSNSIALGFLQACGERKIRIPQDLSVISMDNTKIMALPGIDLTGVSVPLECLAKEGVHVLLERIETGREKNRFVALQPELTVRGSTAPPQRVP